MNYIFNLFKTYIFFKSSCQFSKLGLFLSISWVSSLKCQTIKEGATPQGRLSLNLRPHLVPPPPALIFNCLHFILGRLILTMLYFFSLLLDKSGANALSVYVCCCNFNCDITSWNFVSQNNTFDFIFKRGFSIENTNE